MGWKDTDWIHLARARGKWRILVNAAINFSVAYNSGEIFTEDQELYSTELVV
jgi:hypothetical protein